MKSRLLIVTSKWPDKTNSSDGGNSTVQELIDILEGEYIVDLLYFGKCAKSKLSKKINRIIQYSHDFDHFETYGVADYSKFEMRLKQSVLSAEVIKRYEQFYDKIILIHNMFILGFTYNDYKLMKKMVLFPMFTGEDYRRCGECVPDEYISREKWLMDNVRIIIVPSLREKKTLIEEYEIDEKKIHVIYRCVDRFPYKVHRIKSDEVIMIYIAAIRTQKAHNEAVLLLKKIVDLGINIKLFCIGAIQDKKSYEECLRIAQKNNVADRLFFTGNLQKNEMIAYIEKADINISVSKWETFGRGIFEGFVSGIPTVVLERIECVNEISDKENLPILCDNLNDMAHYICELVLNDSRYDSESKKGKILRKELSLMNVKKKIKYAFELERN